MTLGNKIQALRSTAGLSQEDLAEQLAVSRQAVSKWELDKTVPDVKYIVAISERFGITTDYLLKEGEGSAPQDHGEEKPAPEPPPASAPSPRSAGRTACALLVYGSVLFSTLLACYLGFYCAGDRLGLWPLITVLILAPTFLAVSRGLLGDAEGMALRRYRRTFAVCTAEWGFAIALLCGFAEVVDDLLVGHVMGGFSLPLLLVLTAALLLPLWGLGHLAARGVIRNL